ncbi:hypothetical protein OIU74_005686 [Salix koriyanagi]|uniref:Uncharacterized protein n=1 Tax=Salix koriyanagi TaxID=2511006 RepID=A0A9Q0UPX7_9ROSI|nr:hypothetical protein OIU74_005686 [Salix koriyanagi]
MAKKNVVAARKNATLSSVLDAFGIFSTIKWEVNREPKIAAVPKESKLMELLIPDSAACLLGVAVGPPTPDGDCGEGGACDSEVVLEGEGWGWDDGTDSRSPIGGEGAGNLDGFIGRRTQQLLQVERRCVDTYCYMLS